MVKLCRWWGGAILILGAGCAADGPFQQGWRLEPPSYLIQGEEEHNPVFIPQGEFNYARVFENVLSVLDGYGFEITDSNRRDGRIETAPRIAPGLGLFFKPGSPDFYERALATAQTYRHRVSVVIQPADNGGWFIDVQARKELEDLPKPIRSTVSSAIFRNDSNVDRTLEVIDPSFFQAGWIPKGRDPALELEIIRRIRRLM